ncbi:hypothetical protein Patl1_14004 [Pistacia atlantica]|uniref:Uncharacterized protein n=1 Tax=Pistacia atlantica TaxID=434234 RepID=A0ACC1AVZ6_9ROSI|nr:hypothetical protein Patl1_14004 [Pistacia atlantica]
MDNERLVYTLDEAFTYVGFGKFQVLLLLYAGLGLFPEAMEIMILSFIGPAIKSEWRLSPTQESLLTTVVFAGLLLGFHHFACIIIPRLNWRWLLALSSVPSFAVFLLHGLAPESPRYLCMAGQTADAHRVLEKIALKNGRNLPSGSLLRFCLIILLD